MGKIIWIFTFAWSLAWAETPNLLGTKKGDQLLQGFYQRFPKARSFDLHSIPQKGKQDIEILAGWISNYDQGNLKQILQRARTRMAADQKVYSDMRTKMLENQKAIDVLVKDTPHSDIKSVGYDFTNGLKVISHPKGFLARGAALPEATVMSTLKAQNASHLDFSAEGGADATAMKTLLLYTYLEASGQKHLSQKQAQEINLLYPAKLPDLKATKSLAPNVKPPSKAECKIALMSEDCSTLHVPNNGYAFGGLIDKEGRNRGLDCSSIQAHMLGMDKQLSTMVMSYASRIMNCSDEDKAFFADPKNQKMRKYFYERWGLDTALKNFRNVSQEKLRPGDSIIYRRKSGKSGHYVMYLGKPKNNNEGYYAFDVTRSFSKINGARIKETPYNKEGQDTYYLSPTKKKELFPENECTNYSDIPSKNEGGELWTSTSGTS